MISHRHGVAHGVLLVFFLATAGALGAHGEGTLEIPRSVVAAGGTLPVEGEEFAPEEVVQIRLLGTFDEHDILEVTPDGEGNFSAELEIPADARPGAYRLVAIATDGDEITSLDVRVLEAEPATDAGEDEASTGGTSEAPEARADDMPVERSRSGAEWGVIGLIVGLAGGLGVVLVRNGG